MKKDIFQSSNLPVITDHRKSGDNKKTLLIDMHIDKFSMLLFQKSNRLHNSNVKIFALKSVTPKYQQFQKYRQYRYPAPAS